jgi:hypothetical protein
MISRDRWFSEDPYAPVDVPGEGITGSPIGRYERPVSSGPARVDSAEPLWGAESSMPGVAAPEPAFDNTDWDAHDAWVNSVIQRGLDYDPYQDAAVDRSGRVVEYAPPSYARI